MTLLWFLLRAACYAADVEGPVAKSS